MNGVIVVDILDDDCRFCTFLNWETKDLFWFIQSSSSQCHLNPASVFLSHGMH